MARDGLLIGQVAAQSGVSRKALRLYEAKENLVAATRARSQLATLSTLRLDEEL